MFNINKYKSNLSKLTIRANERADHIAFKNGWNEIAANGNAHIRTNNVSIGTVVLSWVLQYFYVMSLSSVKNTHG